MAVQFILGRSGSGKTTACYRAVGAALREPGADDPLVLLVPEQATLQAERAILTEEGVGGYHRLHVVSFRLLAAQVDRRVGPRALSATGQAMLLHRILTRQRKKLSVLAASADRPGLAQALAKTIAEFQAADLTPTTVADLATDLAGEGASDLLVAKLHDLATVYEAYLAALKDRFIDAGEQLAAAAEAQTVAAFEGARLWVDGFAGFTIQETKTLMALIRRARQTWIALCLDPQAAADITPEDFAPDPTRLFAPTETTYVDLLERLAEQRIPVQEPLMLTGVPRFAVPALRHIEAGLFADESVGKIAAGSAVRVLAAANPRGEVVAVAREICRLVRADDKLRYRKIAVIASDLAAYQHYVRAVFDDYGIPFFLDKPRPAFRHPLVHLLAAVLRMAAEDVTTREVMSYLKTGLTDIAPDDVDLLESYCVAYGVDRAAPWTQEAPWSWQNPARAQFDEARVDKVRRRVMEPLQDLRRRLPTEEPLTAGQLVGELGRFCNQLGVTERLAEPPTEADEHHVAEAADYHRECCKRVAEVLDELRTVLADEEMPVAELSAVLVGALNRLELKLIPPLDHVLVGSIDRSRHPEIDYAFILGATQRQFPSPLVRDAVLSEADRAAMARDDRGVLRPRLDEQLEQRQYLAYIAFTRPAAGLYVTYPAVDAAGAAVERSRFIDDLAALFDDVREEHPTTNEAALPEVYSRRELADILCGGLGPTAETDDDQRRALLDCARHWAQAPATASVISRCEAFLNYRNDAALGADVRTALWSSEALKCSATQLSSFAACPYQHFCRYVLGLERRPVFRLEPVDVGNFYHEALDRLARRLIGQGLDWGTAEPEQMAEAMAAAVAETYAQDPFYAQFAERGLHNRYIMEAAEQTLRECVADLVEIARVGALRCVGTEAPFGLGGAAGGLVVPLPNGRSAVIRGKIDRVDIAEQDGQTIAVVYDYKRRARRMAWASWSYGLDMQLTIYLLALAGGAGEFAGTHIDQVAGAFYLPVEAKPRSQRQSDKDDLDRRPCGLFNSAITPLLDRQVGPGSHSRCYSIHIKKDGDIGRYATSDALYPQDFATVLQATQAHIVELAAGILDGGIDIAPHQLAKGKACDYCDYRPVCRFDWQTNKYRFLEPHGKQEAIARAAALAGAEKGGR